MTLVLKNEEVQHVLTMDACLEILEDAYREQAAGRAMNQLRYDTEMPLPEISQSVRFLGVKDLTRSRISGITPGWVSSLRPLAT